MINFFKRLFCSHKWSVYHKTFLQPNPSCFQIIAHTMGHSAGMIALHGKTNITYICTKCGAKENKEYLGQVNFQSNNPGLLKVVK